MREMHDSSKVIMFQMLFVVHSKNLVNFEILLRWSELATSKLGGSFFKGCTFSKGFRDVCDSEMQANICACQQKQCFHSHGHIFP